jgi:hypothetical protein
MKCPHCGENIKPQSSAWDKPAQQLAEALRERYGDKVFKGRDAEELAKEKGIAKEQFEAYRIWERLRQLPLITGVTGEIHYREWRVASAD